MQAQKEFNKESGNIVEECKLKVVYVSPPQPTSPVPEESEEGSSPKASVSENGSSNVSDFVTPVSKARFETAEKTPEANTLISKLTQEKKSAIQQSNKLREELELLKRESNKTVEESRFCLSYSLACLAFF
ncbi:hypothetical protein GIB67_007932 [Kingdonia uniflora]|uniref:Uncharacterized protein n=1 Tax=Kingdonia uniflora TaxID=39325 RepID=A0A7J7M9N0_9MAGN|nr:hypothetical protein GIB67_007932 [Kingdonia uniflora]